MGLPCLLCLRFIEATCSPMIVGDGGVGGARRSHDQLFPANAVGALRVNTSSVYRDTRVEHRIAIDRPGGIGARKREIQRAPGLHVRGRGVGSIEYGIAGPCAQVGDLIGPSAGCNDEDWLGREKILAGDPGVSESDGGLGARAAIMIVVQGLRKCGAGSSAEADDPAGIDPCHERTSLQVFQTEESTGPAPALLEAATGPQRVRIVCRGVIIKINISLYIDQL